jgi:MerR family transcriptional regulator/heat shock protein HspR
MHRYVKLADIVAELQVDEEYLRTLEAEDLIHPKHSSEGEVLVSADEAERIRLACVLTRELEVNLPGVEVIVHMRESMLAIQRQFSEILDALVEEMRHRVRR